MGKGDQLQRASIQTGVDIRESFHPAEKLKSAEYVRIHKTFKDNKPFTTAAITLKGTEALNAYLDEMESLIKTLKQGGAK